MNKITLLLFCLSAGFFSGSAVAGQDNHHQEHDGDAVGNVAAQLSPAVRDLLIREMQAIQAGMQEVIPAIGSGAWPELQKIGRQIHDSYIMKQSLTAEQMDELHGALPPAFIEMDHAFHHAAGMMAHAAEEHDMDLVNFYFGKMTQACADCHRKFAGPRFPGLAAESTAGKHN